MSIYKGMTKTSKKSLKSDNAGKAFVTLQVAIIIGFLLTLPFFIVEAITTSGFAKSGFPLMLFGMMWFLGSVFVLLILPFVHSRAKKAAKERPLFLVLKVALLFVIAWMWVELVIDQMPCFLGASGC